MSRDYQQQTTDAELLQEQISRAERWLELKDAAYEAFRATEGCAKWRQRLYEALEELERAR